MVGVRYTQRSNGTASTRYFHTDHLGSIAVITDETGVVVERLSYDAWGKRRFANGTDDPTGSIDQPDHARLHRPGGILTDVGLVHLNGRVYDPLVGRMMSADPFVPDPMNAQAWNRYSYVINNPLAFTDPNGYCFLGLCGVGSAVSGAIKSIGKVFNTQFLLGVLKIGAVAVCYVTQGCAVFIPLIAAVTSAVITGVTTGRLDAALQAGVIAGAQALAFQGLDAGIGGSSGFLSGGYFGRAIGSALIGCGAAAASGAKCGAGALSGAITSLAGPITNGQSFAASLIANSMVGGLASVVGGGKFADGAVTGAFQYAIGYAAAQSRQSSAAGSGLGYAMATQDEGAARAQPAGVQVACGPCFWLVGAGIVLAGQYAVQSTYDLLNSGKGGDVLNNENGGRDTLKPGPYAGDSIPARGPDRGFTPEERGQINDIGNDTGCHTCGSTDPGTKSGNFIPDHQPPSALNPDGNPQRLYPQCLSCSRIQGGQVRGAGD